jgi:hypothetical protein
VGVVVLQQVDEALDDAGRKERCDGRWVVD